MHLGNRLRRPGSRLKNEISKRTWSSNYGVWEGRKRSKCSRFGWRLDIMSESAERGLLCRQKKITPRSNLWQRRHHISHYRRNQWNVKSYRVKIVQRRKFTDSIIVRSTSPFNAISMRIGSTSHDFAGQVINDSEVTGRDKCPQAA